MGILQNLATVQERINSAAIKANRNPQDIKLIAVTKTVDLPEIIEAVKAGILILGESRVQEAQRKVASYKVQGVSERIEWHLVGNLQKNKVKNAIQLFDLIHSIDSISLAEEINTQAKKINKTQRVLVQVKISKKETKRGADEKDLMALVTEITETSNLKLEGLMTIPPYFEDAEQARPYFRRLRELRDEAEMAGFKLPELSMGMSNDFEIAIEEGATMVRIGTAIFGERK